MKFILHVYVFNSPKFNNPSIVFMDIKGHMFSL